MRKIVYFFTGIFALIAVLVCMGVIIFVISIPALPFLLGKSADLTCNRLEINYVNCEYQRTHFYGLWSEPFNPQFRVTNAEIKKYEINDREDTYTGYKLYLNTQNDSKELYDYINDSDRAYNDKLKIDDFILGRGDSSLYMKISKSLWGEIELIIKGFLYVMMISMGIISWRFRRILLGQKNY